MFGIVFHRPIKNETKTSGEISLIIKENREITLPQLAQQVSGTAMPIEQISFTRRIMIRLNPIFRKQSS